MTQTAAAVRRAVRPRRRMPLSRFQAQSPREAVTLFLDGQLLRVQQVQPISLGAVIRQTQVSRYTQCGRVTMRPQKPFGTQAANGEKSATTAAQHSRPAPRTVRTLMETGYITVAVSTADTKLVSMVTTPQRNMQAIIPPLSTSSILQVSTKNIRIVPTVIRPWAL